MTSTVLQIRMSTEDAAELEWQDEALCAQVDGDLFFPEKGGSTRDAKRVCRSCEVRAECLEYALDHDERFGVWGGMSERERRRLQRQSAGIWPAIAAADAAQDAARAANAQHIAAQSRVVSEAYWAAKAAQSPPVPQPTEAVA